MRHQLVAAISISSLAFASSAKATLLDTSLTEAVVATSAGYHVTSMGWAPDGSHRLFLTVKRGFVAIVENGKLLPAPFATITPVINTSECGVLGLAFDPDFINNGYVYFFVTVSTTEQQIIRYTATGNVGMDKTTIVAGLPTIGANHDGGGIAFGPDGKLYWAVGDNGPRIGIKQDLKSLAAKVGRVNADGSVPRDNPFVDGPGPNEDRIWARGFRNPFTLKFQPSTDLLWVNTVGGSAEQIFVVRAGDHAGWNDYENNQPTGFLAPIVVYRNNGIYTSAIVTGGAKRSGGIATFTTAQPHGLRRGSKVTIAGVAKSSFNTSGYASDVLSPTEFIMAQPGPDTSSGGGTATTLAIGGAVTGGAFWDSSAVPEAYRGNFFFGDYASGRIERVALDAANNVTSVDHWAMDMVYPIDIDVGPDGDLYYTNLWGTIYRASYVTTTEALVVSRLHIRAAEGGAAAFNVRLATAPAADVDVLVARSSGDADVSVTAGSELKFTSQDWATPKLVQIAAAGDADADDDSATISVSSANLKTEDVVLRVTDKDPTAFTLSDTDIILDEGARVVVDVVLTDPPFGSVVANVTRTAGDSDVAIAEGAQLTFTETNWSMPQQVTLAAGEDDDNTDDSAVLEVSAVGVPTRVLDVRVRDDDAAIIDSGSRPEPDASAQAQSDAGRDQSSCGCRAVEARSRRSPWLVLVAPIALAARRRRRAN